MTRPLLLARLVLAVAFSSCLAAPPADAVAANLLTNPSFEATGAGWLAPWSFTYRTGAAGTISQATLPDGSHAAAVNVTQQSSSSPWLVQLSQAKLPLSSGQAYTISFAAKASIARQVETLLQGTASPYTTYLSRSFSLTTSWATYSVTFTAGSTLSDASLRFNLASALGTVWIDNVVVETGASENATLSPTGDAYVRSDLPSQNYGSASTLTSDGSPATAAYMKFDLGAFAGKSISKAVLRMKVVNASSGSQSVRTSLDTAWGESSITYANRPALGSAVTTFPGGATGAWVDVDVTSAVAARAGLPITLAIDSANSDGFAVNSREAAADRVHLVVQVGSAPPPPPPPPPPSKAKGVSLTPFAEYWGSNLAGMKSDFADMAAAGISWARIDLRYTSSPNAAFDAAVQAAKAQGIQLLAVVHKSAPANDLGTDTQRATFRAWLAQMVLRHKHHIRHWEIHNEPNLHYEWNIDESAGSDQTRYADSVRRYVTHLRDGYETVKANDPGATVLFGGLSEWTVERFMDVVVTTDAYRYFDVMAFHPYGSTPDRVLSRFTSFTSKMAINGNYASKPVWVTETGFNTSWTNKAGFVTSEQTKADYLVSSAKRLYAAGATLPLFVYTLHENSSSPGYGLISKDPATLRTQYFPAFYAFRDLAF